MVTHASFQLAMLPNPSFAELLQVEPIRSLFHPPPTSHDLDELQAIFEQCVALVVNASLQTYGVEVRIDHDYLAHVPPHTARAAPGHLPENF